MKTQPKGKEIMPTQEEITKDEPSSSQDKARSLDKEKIPYQTLIHTRSLEDERLSQIEELENEAPQL